MMKRRTFIRNIALGGLAASTPLRLYPLQAGLPDIGYVEGESPAELTKKAVSLIGGMSRFVSRGARVVVKPNIGWDRTPEMAANTNPDVVAAVVEMALEAGAKEAVVIDNTTNQAKRCYVRSGIQEAARQAGARVIFMDERRVRKMPIGGEWIKEWDVLLDVIETDVLINVPIAKHHSLCRLTLGMKNWLGGIAGARNQLHQDIDKAVVDLAAFFKPALTVLDGYRILIRNGPQGGRISDTELKKTVAAGVDPVAVEAVGASLFDIDPKDLPFIKMGQDRGLGQLDLGSLHIEKRTI
ncbi:MAG: DUF362 domain-containing protein [Acidobacteriota bacterium]|nr:DUF362 domain-containing protein [Acidobacteriota bacterium]